MSIPDFQTIMLPLLKYMADGKERTVREAADHLAAKFRLTENERKELLPSGQQEVFLNRVGWARTYMRKAGLFESKERGLFNITERGKKVLRENPKKINIKFLDRFPEFKEFRTKKRKKTEHKEPKTPEEILEDSYMHLKDELGRDLLQRVKDSSPSFFEKLVVELLVKMGYGGTRKDAGEALGKSGDEGIDGIIKEDRLGLDIVYIQAKKWENPVSRPEIQKFAGALMGKRGKKGIFITTSSFSESARRYVKNLESKVILIDGEELAQYMIDFDVGVSKLATYEVKKIDSDYFTEE